MKIRWHNLNLNQLQRNAKEKEVPELEKNQGHHQNLGREPNQNLGREPNQSQKQF